MKKRLLAAIMSLAMILTLLPATVLAIEPDSGSCGSGVTWSYDGAGTLTISGRGAMNDYQIAWGSNAPWSTYQQEITHVVISSGVTRIGDGAFGGEMAANTYPDLISIRLPDTLTSIGEYAFAGAGISSIELPNSLETIDIYAFAYTNLVEITIPENVNQLSETAFRDCSNLKAINVVSGNLNYFSDGGVLYQKFFGEQYHLLAYPLQKNATTYSVLNGTVEIAKECFASNHYLHSVTLPDGLTELPPMAFLDCANLNSITLPDNLYSVDSTAFCGCTSLLEIHIPASVSSFTSEYWPGEWYFEYVPLSVYFYGSAAPKFDAGIAALRYSDCPVTIYYPENATGWDAVQQQDDLSWSIDDGALLFKTWKPGSTGDPETPPTSDKATILQTYPISGATDVGYDASDKPYFEITFDRDISAVTTHNGFVFANLDFSKGSMRIFRSADDMLIYEVTYDDYMNDIYEIEGTVSGDTEVRNGKTLVLDPFNAHTLLTAGTDYYVTVDEGFIQFEDGTVNPAINKGQWAFKTAPAEYFSTTENILIKTGSDNNPTALVSTDWDDGWFVAPATTYNHQLAETSMVLSGAAYVESAGEPSSHSIQNALEAFDFDEIQSYNYNYHHTESDNDIVAYTFAVKRIQDISYDTTFLVAVVIKGTSGNEEWYSNFNIGTGNSHKGFTLAKEELMRSLEEYLAGLGLTSSFKENTKFLVTGHSRGAAVANLVAADLSYSSHANRSNVYGYTFATPTVAVMDTDLAEDSYDNIFNIINGEDFITQVPLSTWGYTHYGIDLELPSRSYYDSGKFDKIYAKMSSAYRTLVNESFESFNGTYKVDSLVSSVNHLAPTVMAFYNNKHYLDYSLFTKDTTVDNYFSRLADGLVGGFGISEISFFTQSELGDYRSITNFFLVNHLINPRIFSAHSMAGYYSWLSTCSEEELFGTANRRTHSTFKRMTTACPVDVYVYNEAGNLVASVVNETVEVDILAVNVEDGVKIIDLPTDQDYSVKIIATGDGTMDYTVQELSAEATGNTILRTVFFDDVELAVNDTFTSEVNDSLNTSSKNYALTKNVSEMIYATNDSLQADQGDDESFNGSDNTSTSPTTYSISLPGKVTGGEVSLLKRYAEEGETVTITITPDEGYELDELTITDSKGTELDLTDKGSGKYTFKMPAGRVEIEASFKEIVAKPVNPFVDVSASDYYYDAVLWAVENGVTSGTNAEGTLFSPDVTVTRAQAMTFLWRAHGSPKATGTNPFTDVSTSDYYYDAVLWAVANGVTNGTSTTTFSPDTAVTRSQAVTFQWRAAGSPAMSGSGFADVAANAYYAAAVTWASKEGITAGTNAAGTLFSPDAVVSRAQAVTFLWRELAE